MLTKNKAPRRPPPAHERQETVASSAPKPLYKGRQEWPTMGPGRRGGGRKLIKRKRKRGLVKDARLCIRGGGGQASKVQRHEVWERVERRHHHHHRRHPGGGGDPHGPVREERSSAGRRPSYHEPVSTYTRRHHHRHQSPEDTEVQRPPRAHLRPPSTDRPRSLERRRPSRTEPAVERGSRHHTAITRPPAAAPAAARPSWTEEQPLRVTLHDGRVVSLEEYKAIQRGRSQARDADRKPWTPDVAGSGGRRKR